jgi:hypothetical protein
MKFRCDVVFVSSVLFHDRIGLRDTVTMGECLGRPSQQVRAGWGIQGDCLLD